MKREKDPVNRCHNDENEAFRLTLVKQTESHARGLSVPRFVSKTRQIILVAPCSLGCKRDRRGGKGSGETSPDTAFYCLERKRSFLTVGDGAAGVEREQGGAG